MMTTKRQADALHDRPRASPQRPPAHRSAEERQLDERYLDALIRCGITTALRDRLLERLEALHVARQRNREAGVDDGMSAAGPDGSGPG